jgi:isoleucyl-tRNA synthetase
VLQSLVANVNSEMEAYRLYAVVPPIIDFVGDLTNWYIRRSRRRFWAHRGPSDNFDKMAAFATLYEVLALFTRVAAPILPFVTEEIYQGLVRQVDDDAPASVHHTDYPEADVDAIDVPLERSMQIVRTVVTLGRGLRKHHDLRVRQPLAKVTVVTRSPEEQTAVESHSALIAEELNVASVNVHANEAGLVDLGARANFKELGPRYGREMKRVAAAIASLDHDTIAALLDGETLELDGFTLAGDDLVVTRSPREGTVVATEGSISVALDTEISDDLAVEGVARELVNRVQGLRKRLDLDVTDRIDIVWSSSDAPVAEAFSTHQDMIATEVLAETITEGENDGEPFAIGDINVTLSVSAGD